MKVTIRPCKTRINGSDCLHVTVTPSDPYIMKRVGQIVGEDHHEGGEFKEYVADNEATRGILLALVNEDLNTGSTESSDYQASLLAALSILWD